MIEGKNIILRMFTDEDFEYYCRRTSVVADVGEHWPIRLRSRTQLLKAYEEDGFWGNDWGKMIIASKEGKPLGCINYFKGIPYVDGYEIGYRIFNPKNRGKGYTTEAVKLFCSYFFHTKNINRLQLCLVPDNQGSRRVAEKCGFKYEGRLRKAVFDKGQYLDIEIFSLLKDECPIFNQTLNEVCCDDNSKGDSIAQ